MKLSRMILMCFCIAGSLSIVLAQDSPPDTASAAKTLNLPYGEFRGQGEERKQSSRLYRSFIRTDNSASFHYISRQNSCRRCQN